MYTPTANYLVEYSNFERKLAQLRKVRPLCVEVLIDKSLGRANPLEPDSPARPSPLESLGENGSAQKNFGPK